ncbi:hypothetical protein [Dickeya zeae]|uniref:hypothetical protein n=1 Tax=Dickeya zeae TaxID=204042 RepID=UPI001CF32BED|nr:hypothetical protein [Dickeya zeae]MCA6985443.1 hypothetical protein [Dickeya zeae]
MKENYRSELVIVINLIMTAVSVLVMCYGLIEDFSPNFIINMLKSGCYVNGGLGLFCVFLANSIKSIEKYKRQKLTPTSGIFFFILFLTLILAVYIAITYGNEENTKEKLKRIETQSIVIMKEREKSSKKNPI